jgi:predicted amidohydrolase
VSAVRVGLIQLCSSDDPEANLGVTERLVREAADGGAALIVTPECTNIVSASRTRQREMLVAEAADPTLARMRGLANELSVTLLAGSLCLREDGADGGADDVRFVNRSVLIGPDGAVVARYDKIHMFDVELDGGESHRESAVYRPGRRAVVAEAAGARLGLSICYDLRFPQLYRALARDGAQILCIPSAFTVPTGRAHWEVLLRARAIECGAFVLAPAQSGEHACVRGRPRRTYGHSLAVAPWGEVLVDAGAPVGVSFADLDLADVTRARGQVPSLTHDRPFSGP